MVQKLRSPFFEQSSFSIFHERYRYVVLAKLIDAMRGFGMISLKILFPSSIFLLNTIIILGHLTELEKKLKTAI